MDLAARRLGRLVYADARQTVLDLGRRSAKLLQLEESAKRAAKCMKIGAAKNTPVLKATEVTQNNRFSETKPIIFVSACVNREAAGGWKYNGGIKELNLLVKLLRRHNYEAYMVTFDGTYEPWLIEHQPHISLEKFRSEVQLARNSRCVTSWALSSAFIEACDRLYFWDMELAYTDQAHFPVLAKLYKTRIEGIAAISRTIQSWHMANFERPCVVIPNILDDALWHPNGDEKSAFLVGYMDEGFHTEEYVALFREKARVHQVPLRFFQIKGSEAEVLSGMRACRVFLSLNLGKDPLWGEGCPRTIIEALSTGCVVIAFDTVGNLEMIHNNFNGVLVPRYRPDHMSEALIGLYANQGEIERLSSNALSLIHACHTLDARWPVVKEFLKLPS